MLKFIHFIFILYFCVNLFGSLSR